MQKGDKISGTIGESGSAVIYVTKTFGTGASSTINENSKNIVCNKATVAPPETPGDNKATTEKPEDFDDKGTTGVTTTKPSAPPSNPDPIDPVDSVDPVDPGYSEHAGHPEYPD